MRLGSADVLMLLGFGALITAAFLSSESCGIASLIGMGVLFVFAAANAANEEEKASAKKP